MAPDKASPTGYKTMHVPDRIDFTNTCLAQVQFVTKRRPRHLYFSNPYNTQQGKIGKLRKCCNS